MLQFGDHARLAGTAEAHRARAACSPQRSSVRSDRQSPALRLRHADRLLGLLFVYAQFNAATPSLLLTGRIVRERGAVVTKATIKRDLVALSSIMNFCVAQEWRESNPVLPWLKTVKERRDPVAEPRDYDIELLISMARGMWPELIRAALVTGVREGALVNSRRDDLNHERQELTVKDKGNKVRVIDLKPMGGYTLFAGLPAFAGKPWLFWRTEHNGTVPTVSAATASDKIEDPGPTFVRERQRVSN